MVCPASELTTSPGLMASPEGMFSVDGMTATTFIFGFSSPRDLNTPSTVAAPPMSYFISSMPAPGLSEIPPVSKVTPLPTRAIGASPFLPP